MFLGSLSSRDDGSKFDRMPVGNYSMNQFVIRAAEVEGSNMVAQRETAD